MKLFYAFLVLLCAVAVGSAQTGPTCPAGVNHCASITWTPGTGAGSPATSYNVYRSTTTGGCATVTAPACTKAGSTTAPTVTYLDQPLAASTTYFYVVTAVNSAGESGASGQGSAATGPDPVTVPPVPGGVNVTAK